MEKLYADIIDSIEDGIVVFDKDFNILLFNQMAESITGLSKSRAMNTKGESLFCDNKRLLDQVKKSLKNGQVFSDYDTDFFRPDGTVASVSLITSPVLSPEGEYEGTTLLIRDIRRVKELEEDLRRSDSLVSVGVLAAGLAHEIKNPLGGIRGAAQLLQMEVEENKELVEYTSLIVRETDRVTGLIEELLDYANPKTLKKEQVNIHEILDSVIALQSRSEATRETTFVTDYDPSIPPLVGDSDKLAQVLLNIIKNGCEAMDGRGSLKVVTRVVNDFMLNEGTGGRSTMIAVDVIDSGPGISEEAQRMLFTPFYTKKRGGTGLGLAVSHRIVEGHKGHIKVESKEGEGATFSLYLPLR